MSSAPSDAGEDPGHPARRAAALGGGSGRLRIALTMFIRLTRHAENVTTASVSSTPSA